MKNIKIKKGISLLIAFFLHLSVVMSQVPENSLLSANSRHLMLEIDAEGFFFDAEFETPLATGCTVTGFRLSPSLVYGINERAQLRVGFNATLFAGLDSLYNLRPTMTLLYKPIDWLTFVAGTLLDDNHHRLPSPVINPSRHIFHYQEDGIQVFTNTRRWQSDTWLDWTHYLTPWTPDQELFTMGSKHALQLMRLGVDGYQKYFAITLPAHFMASHRGGEMKTIDTNTVTTFNESVGLRFDYFFSNKETNRNLLALELPIFFYHLEDRELDDGGGAFYPRIKYQWTHTNRGNQFQIQNYLGFWHGEHYFSAYGSPQYWSLNDYSRQHLHLTPSGEMGIAVSDIRNLLSYQLTLEQSFDGVALGLLVDALHDIDNGFNDFVFVFFIRYKGAIKIK